VSPEERHQAEILHAAVEISRFSGPLPHPEDLAKYEQVLPGSADRIISMAEQQAEHRRNLEKSVILSNVALQKWGPRLRVHSGNDSDWWGDLVIVEGDERGGIDGNNFCAGSPGWRFCVWEIRTEERVEGKG
jgi:hypothetical protein